MAYLVLVRHGKSEWNKKGLWTGWNDVELSADGIIEAQNAAVAIKDIKIDKVYISDLKRAQQTFKHMRPELNQDIEIVINSALRERHYGIYAGKSKWDLKEEIGEEEFQKLRRGWDQAIPDGESLKDVYSRVIPYFEKYIFPDLNNEKNILIVAHGNSLRALIKRIEGISDEGISDLEVGLGEVYCYNFDTEGSVVAKELRASNPNKGKI